MAVLISTQPTSSLTSYRRIKSFTVTIPEKSGATASLTATFVKATYDNTGALIEVVPDQIIVLSQAALAALLPTANLPAFATLYQGLSDLIHSQYPKPVPSPGPAPV